MRLLHTPPRRRVSGLIAALAVATAGLASASAFTAPAVAAPATFLSGSVVESNDFASTTFGDPWDFSNPGDLLLDSGPTAGIHVTSWSGGVLTYTATGASYVSPLWGGYPGSLALGRDGQSVVNQIDAHTYTRMHLHAYSSRPVAAALFWFTQDGLKGVGGKAFSLRAGWNDYDLPMVNSFPGKAGWSGKIHGLRLTVSTGSSSARIALDSLRVYAPERRGSAVWHSVTGGPERLFWSTGSDNPVTNTDHSGQVVDAHQPGGAYVGASGTDTTDLSGYAAGAHFYAVTSTGSIRPIGPALSLIARPHVSVDSPTVTGCNDWAAAARGSSWNFSRPGSVASFGNAGAVSYAGGYLSATNAGPVRNDPNIVLPVGANGIDGRVWHRLTIVEGYDGAFNLSGRPGGGTMGRVMWKVPGQKNYSVSDDIVTYSGKRTITIDMARPASILTDPGSPAGTRLPFASGNRVVTLRWDPNEDPGARRWHVYSIRLSRDCTVSTAGTFATTWHDGGYRPGSIATVFATSGSHSVTLGNLHERAGENSFAVRGSKLGRGSWALHVTVQNAGAIVSASAGSPLVVS